MTAKETHWDIIIETDVPKQLTVRCGCGWSEEIAGQSAASIGLARVHWDAHDCAGRPILPPLLEGNICAGCGNEVDRDRWCPCTGNVVSNG